MHFFSRNEVRKPPSERFRRRWRNGDRAGRFTQLCDEELPGADEGQMGTVGSQRQVGSLATTYALYEGFCFDVNNKDVAGQREGGELAQRIDCIAGNAAC